MKFVLTPCEGQDKRRGRVSEERIISILKEHEAGLPVAGLCRKHRGSDGSIYRWKARFGGMAVSEAKRLRALEDENAKLKRMLAEAMLANVALKDFWERSGDARSEAESRRASRGASRDERTAGV